MSWETFIRIVLTTLVGYVFGYWHGRWSRRERIARSRRQPWTMRKGARMARRHDD